MWKYGPGIAWNERGVPQWQNQPHVWFPLAKNNRARALKNAASQPNAIEPHPLSAVKDCLGGSIPRYGMPGLRSLLLTDPLR